MYGRIGKIITVEGKREELVEILLSGTSMPGCLSYVVAADSTGPNGLWISEVWETRANHSASLSLPAVRDAIARGKPLIAGFSHGVETVRLGGHGLK